MTNYENSMSHFLLIMNSIVVIGLGSTFVVNGDLTVGTLIGFNIFASRALQISMSAQRSFYNMKKINGYFKKNKEFLNLLPEKEVEWSLIEFLGVFQLRIWTLALLKTLLFYLEILTSNLLRDHSMLFLVQMVQERLYFAK